MKSPQVLIYVPTSTSENRIPQLKKLLVEHRKCVSHVTEYRCLCGEPLSSNSQYAMSQHQAEVVNEYIVKLLKNLRREVKHVR